MTNKKIIALISALVLVVIMSFTGCMPASNAAKVQKVTSPATTDEISYTDYEDSLEGLCRYFADLGYAYEIKDATADQISDPVVMQADMIGAERGYKFTYTYDGDNTVLELYYYSDTDNKYYEQAKTEGKITVDPNSKNGTVDVVLSDNGKYLMVYSDDIKGEEREEAIKKAFKGFYA